MIYTLHEIQQSFAGPLHLWAEASRQWCSNPFSPFSYTPAGRKMAAGSELLARLVRHYEKPDFGLVHTLIDGREVAIKEHIVVEKPFCKLRHFQRQLPKNLARSDPRVLLVAPMSGHHATLLRDTVRAFLPGHDVYITDWNDARTVPIAEGAFHFADYVAYLQEFMARLGPDLHVVAVCQPTVPLLAAVSLMAAQDDPAQPASMTLMGGPIDTRRAQTEVNRFAKAHSLRWFETQVIARVPLRYPGYMRRVYPGFLQHAGFVAMNQDRHLRAHADFYRHLIEGDGDSAKAHRKFYDEYNAVMDLPAEYYLETIDMVFHRHLLPLGEMVIGSERVAPEAIRKTALFTIEGELDDISGAGQTVAAHDLCPAIADERKRHYLVPGVGHYGIFSGRRWRETICPKVAEFIRASA